MVHPRLHQPTPLYLAVQVATSLCRRQNATTTKSLIATGFVPHPGWSTTRHIWSHVRLPGQSSLTGSFVQTVISHLIVWLHVRQLHAGRLRIKALPISFGPGTICAKVPKALKAPEHD